MILEVSCASYHINPTTKDDTRISSCHQSITRAITLPRVYVYSLNIQGSLPDLRPQFIPQLPSDVQQSFINQRNRPLCLPFLPAARSGPTMRLATSACSVTCPRASQHVLPIDATSYLLLLALVTHPVPLLSRPGSSANSACLLRPWALKR